MVKWNCNRLMKLVPIFVTLRSTRRRQIVFKCLKYLIDIATTYMVNKMSQVEYLPNKALCQMSTFQATSEVCLTKYLSRSWNSLFKRTVSQQLYDDLNVIGALHWTLRRSFFHKICVLLWYRQYVYWNIEPSFLQFDFFDPISSISLKFYL